MKTNFIILIVGIIIIVAGVFIYQTIKIVPKDETPPITTTQDEVKGCYVARLAKDVYTLTISSQNGESFEGTLAFKNFEKDSSSGTYKGTYKDGILLGDYSFQSEGMYSVMQVIFKKVGDTFIRGYGDMNITGDGFADLNNITYDSKAIFNFSKENCINSAI